MTNGFYFFLVIDVSNDDKRVTKDLCTYAQTYEEKAEYGGGGVSFLPINRRIEVRNRKLTSNIFAHYFSISMDGCLRTHEKEG